MPSVAFIALGSNLGARDAHLQFARERLGALPRTRVLASSDVEETAPLGGLTQPPYLNQMVALETDLPPRDLLRALQGIEAERGRVRDARWSSRTLDLDIVLYEGIEMRAADLTLPHPGLPSRDFWQRQLAEVRQRLAPAR